MKILQRLRHELDSLSILTQHSRFLLAYSGGIDSHVLLHACYTLGLPLRAIHVHHGLQAEADEWVLHCQQVCKSLAVPLTVSEVDASSDQGQSPEDAARIARYEAIRQHLQPEEVVLMAQHMDDQAETFLLQLMRGGSAAGLAAMPVVRKMGQGYLFRPLLSVSREEIHNYAREQRLNWIEDPSNQDTAIDRNYIRHQLIPFIQSRWPSCRPGFARAAGLQQENLEIIEAMAAIDLACILVRENSVSIPRLKMLSEARQKNVLRYWLKTLGAASISRNRLHEILFSVIQADADTDPSVNFGSHAIRRFKDLLYYLPASRDFDSSCSFSWRPTTTLKIESAGIFLKPVYEPQSIGLDKQLQSKCLTVRFRQGGERIKLPGKDCHSRVKTLLQQAEIPPWQRKRIPLVYLGDALVAVGSYWYSADYISKAGEEGWGVSVQYTN